MKISSKTTYGIRFMLSLAVAYDNGFVRLKDIAIEENISEKYLESIVAAIKPLGVIEVKRGSTGGYKLAKSPTSINIIDIFDVLDGATIVDAELTEGETVNCQIVNNMWRELNQKVKEYLSKKKLSDLLEEYNNKNTNPMYYI
jgi:Rrf2 family protein